MEAGRSSAEGLGEAAWRWRRKRGRSGALGRPHSAEATRGRQGDGRANGAENERGNGGLVGGLREEVPNVCRCLLRMFPGQECRQTVAGNESDETRARKHDDVVFRDGSACDVGKCVVGVADVCVGEPFTDVGETPAAREENLRCSDPGYVERGVVEDADRRMEVFQPGTVAPLRVGGQ